MDQVLPVDVRQKALAMAMNQSKAAPAPSSAPAAKPARTKAQPKPQAAPKPKPPVETVVAAPAPKRTVQEAPPTLKPAPVASSGGWRIQLGAFSQRTSAEALYRRLGRSLGGHQAYYVPVGKITRLQVGPYPSREAASAACASLHGQACFPVAAK
jgi:hypothetical protein